LVYFHGFRWFSDLTSVFAGKIVEKKKSQPSTEFSDWGEKMVRASREYPTLAAKNAAKMGHPDL